MAWVLAAAAVAEGENQEQARRQTRATGWFCCRMQGGGNMLAGMVCDSAGALFKAPMPVLGVKRRRGEDAKRR
jgi:hypothetical protein